MFLKTKTRLRMVQKGHLAYVYIRGADADGVVCEELRSRLPRTVYLTPVAMARLDVIRPDDAIGLRAGYRGHSRRVGMARHGQGRRAHA